MTSPARRARAFVRCYPKGWRDRYGDEFSALLEQSMTERPRWTRRCLNVVREATLAHLEEAGLIGRSNSRNERARAGVGVGYVGLLGFVTIAAASTGLIGTSDQSGSFSAGWNAGWTAVSFFEAGALGAAFAAVALFPLVVIVIRGLAKPARRSLLGPVTLVGLGGALLAANASFFRSSLVGWLTVGLAGLICGAVGTYKLSRRVEISRQELRFERLLLSVAAVGTALISGSIFWILVDATPGWPDFADPAQAGSFAGAVAMLVCSSLVVLGLVRSFSGRWRLDVQRPSGPGQRD